VTCYKHCCTLDAGWMDVVTVTTTAAVLPLLLSLQTSLNISMMIKIRYSNIIGRKCVKLALDLKQATTMQFFYRY